MQEEANQEPEAGGVCPVLAWAPPLAERRSPPSLSHTPITATSFPGFICVFGLALVKFKSQPGQQHVTTSPRAIEKLLNKSAFLYKRTSGLA